MAIKKDLQLIAAVIAGTAFCLLCLPLLALALIPRRLIDLMQDTTRKALDEH